MQVKRIHGARFIRLLIIGLYLSSTPALSLPAQSADHPALSALINKFFNAYQRKSLNELMSLWSAGPPDLAAQKHSMQQSFVDIPEIASETLALKSINVNGDKANVQVRVWTRTAEAQKGEANNNYFLKINRTFHCVREAGDWKIWSYLPSEVELASALAKANTEEERQTFLAKDKDLVTQELQKALVAQGDRLFRLGSYPQALVIYRQALTVAEQHGDRRGKGVALRSIGTIHYYHAEYDEALRCYQESLQLADATRGKEEKTRALNNIGNVFFVRGKYAEAKGYYGESLRIAEELGNKGEIARALNNLGNIYASQDDYLQALGSYKKSMLLKDELGDKGGVSIALYNIGMAFYRLGNYTKALENYAGSLKITEALGRKAGVASILRAIGDIHYAQGNDVHALINYSRSLSLAQELKDRAGTATTLNSIGQALYSAGRYAEALEHYRRSLKLAEELGDQKELIRAVNNIGLLYQSQRDYVRAMEYYQRSLSLYEKRGRISEIVYGLRSVGNVNRLAGDNTQALEAYKKGLKLAEEAGYTALAASLENEIATIHYSEGRYIKAIETSSRVASMIDHTSEPQIYSDARLTSGKSYQALGKLEQARQAFADAIEKRKYQRREISMGRREPQALRDSLAPYHAMIALLVAQNRFAEAFNYAEIAKGRLLHGVLQDSALNITNGISQRERAQEQSYAEEIASLSSQIHYEQLKQSPDKAHLSGLNARLKAARQTYYEFESRLYAAHPQLKVNRGEIRPLTLSEAKLLLPDAKTALLEFVVMEKRTYLFVLTRGELKVYPIEISREELARHVENLRKNLIEQKPDFTQFARQLYDLLLKPARKQVDGKTSLCIVPDNVLWKLPFNALRSREGRYLIEDYAVFYTPFLASLRRPEKMPGSVLPDGSSGDAREPTLPALLAFANPTPDKVIEETIKLLYGAEPFSTMETEREVKTLENLYDAAQSKSYTGEDAREERAKEEAGKYRKLHFATFGVINNSSPMSSYVLLSRAKSNADEDGLLMASELLQFNLQADLTVLSAFQNADARTPGGEGIIALSWALGVAGCPALVISQWSLEDSASTTEFMLELHRKMNFKKQISKSVKLKAEALRSAELKLLASEAYRHPYYWSRFMLVSRN